jgi:hypothetical protein
VYNSSHKPSFVWFLLLQLRILVDRHNQVSPNLDFWPLHLQVYFNGHITNRERQLSTSTAAKILPLVLSLIQLRRVKGQEIDVLGEKAVIGGDIPPYRVTTVELEMRREEYHRYLAIHGRLPNWLSAGGSEGEGEGASTEGHIDMASHRLLSHACVHTGLDHFRKNKKATTAKVVPWNERKDYGYAFFHRLTRMDQCASPIKSVWVLPFLSLGVTVGNLSCLIL